VAPSPFSKLEIWDGARCLKEKPGDQSRASITVTPAGRATCHADVCWEEARQHPVYVAKISPSRAPAWHFLLTEHLQTALCLAVCQASVLASPL